MASREDMGDMDLSGLMSRIRGIEIVTRRLVDSILQGAYKSRFMGRGLDFSEVREYIQGDDIRCIDWNVTARTGRLHVKKFIEERDLTVMILYDVSPSTYFGVQELKSQFNLRIASVLMFSALLNNDRVGLCLFSDRVLKYVPPARGRRHVLKLIREILVQEPVGRSTDLNSAVKFMLKLMRTSGVIFIVSDFFADFDQVYLRMLARRHDVIGICVLDPMEDDLPDGGYLLLEDSETGEQMIVNTSDAVFRDAYRSEMERRKKHLKTIFRKAGADIMFIHTGEDFVSAIRRFFIIRRRRGRT